MDVLDVGGQVRHSCKAFTTAWVRAGDGIGGSGVDSVDVPGEVAFLFEAFITLCAGEGRRVG